MNQCNEQDVCTSTVLGFPGVLGWFGRVVPDFLGDGGVTPGLRKPGQKSLSQRNDESQRVQCAITRRKTRSGGA